MSALNSTGRSGSDNPYTKVLSEDYLVNADGQEVKRTKAQPRRSAIWRFFEKIEISTTRFYKGTPCWDWIGTKTNGYGQFRSDGRRGAKKSSPHQYAYEAFIGPMPEGMEPDHLCRNRGCGNPLHLEAVTHAENIRRRSETMTQCKAGHEFNEENTQYIGAKRKCRLCNRRRVQEFYERKRQNSTISG
jgi:hypothetical protein